MGSGVFWMSILTFMRQTHHQLSHLPGPHQCLCIGEMLHWGTIDLQSESLWCPGHFISGDNWSQFTEFNSRANLICPSHQACLERKVGPIAPENTKVKGTGMVFSYPNTCSASYAHPISWSLAILIRLVWPDTKIPLLLVEMVGLVTGPTRLHLDIVLP